MTLHHTGIPRASWPMGARIALLLSAVLWALIVMLASALAQAGAVQKETITERAAQFVKTDAPTMNALVQAAAAAMAEAAVQTAKAQAAVLVPPPPAAPPAAAAPPPPADALPPQTIVIPAEIRDAVLSLCGILITAGIGAGLTWMRAHFAFMKEAGANAAITSSAQGLGALLEQELAKHGASLSTVSVNDPTVAAFAQKLIASYPEWGPLVGLTPDVAARKVLGGAIEQSVVPIVPAPTVTVVQPTPPLAVVEAAATPQSPPPA